MHIDMKDMKEKIWNYWKWSRNCNRNHAGPY